MPFKPKFIYFDLDDTLLNHKQAEAEALKDVCNHFDEFESVSVNRLIDVYHQVNARQWTLYAEGRVNREQLQRNRFEITLNELGLDGNQYETVGNYYMQCYQNHWQWIDGAQEALKQIRRRFEVGILTNGFAETQKKKFTKFNLYDQAQYLVISEEVGHLKPHPEVFRYATKLTGCEPGEILYVGDSYSSDVKGGYNFGWKVAWFTPDGNGQESPEANFIFDDFKDLCEYLNM